MSQMKCKIFLQGHAKNKKNKQTYKVMQISLSGNIKVVVKKTLHRHELGGDLVQLVHKGV